MFVKLLFLVLGLLVVFPAAAQDAEVLDVFAVAETDPSPGDGATAPLIWLHPTDLVQSLVIGTDDNSGIGVYDLDGRLLSFEEQYGPMGGADLRYGFGSQGAALIAAGVSDEARMVFFTIEPETRALVLVGEVATNIRLAGVCLYHSPLTRVFYAVGFSEYGEVEQYALSEDDGELRPTLARAINVGGELEGCATDDALRRLYFAEGENLVWRYGAEPEDGIQRRIVDFVGGHISEEIEGLTVYTTADAAGYLIVTNEKADSLLLYERAGDNRFVGEFRVRAGETADAVSEPTGVTVSNLPLDARFPQGLFVTSDDVNSSPNGNNNFKLVSWADVAAGLSLTVDTTYDPRAGQSAAAQDAAAVTARLETIPVPTATDAADDPAIWVHPEDRALSLIIGTDKRNGLVTYNLDGSVQQTINIGRVNNVDVRDGFSLNGQPISLVTATNRSEGSLVIYAVDVASRQLVDVAARAIIPGVEEVYGVCMYTSAISGNHYVFVNSADTGEVEQYELFEQDGRVDARLVRSFVVGSQTEGCAADDAQSVVYIGEEAAGLWKYGAEPDAGEERILVDSTGEDGHLTADVEGVTIYPIDDETGYIIVSSQGSSTFVVYQRQGDNAYIGTFRIVESAAADAVSGTDGLDVTAFALGDLFPDGVLVVQDDLNISPQATQNFKFVSWRDIADALGLTVAPR
ncbi:MAG: phytase [Chloroflexi bacterium]|nr:phytase [Chloroflexota bacterium]